MIFAAYRSMINKTRPIPFLNVDVSFSLISSYDFCLLRHLVMSVESCCFRVKIVSACAEDRATLESDLSADAGECTDGRGLIDNKLRLSLFPLLTSVYSRKR